VGSDQLTVTEEPYSVLLAAFILVTPSLSLSLSLSHTHTHTFHFLMQLDSTTSTQSSHLLDHQIKLLPLHHFIHSVADMFWLLCHYQADL